MESTVAAVASMTNKAMLFKYFQEHKIAYRHGKVYLVAISKAF